MKRNAGPDKAAPDEADKFGRSTGALSSQSLDATGCCVSEFLDTLAEGPGSSLYNLKPPNGCENRAGLEHPLLSGITESGGRLPPDLQLLGGTRR